LPLADRSKLKVAVDSILRANWLYSEVVIWILLNFHDFLYNLHNCLVGSAEINYVFLNTFK